jgi:hypothetical protein
MMMWPVAVLYLLYLNFDLGGAEYQQQTGDQWNTADYFKREHSLTRPYQGKLSGTGVERSIRRISDRRVIFECVVRWLYIIKLMFGFLGSGWQIPNWDFHGSTIVTNQYVRLTPDSRSQQGAIWNSVVS